MKYAKLTRDFYKTTICSLFFFVVTMAILPGDLYAQANSRLTYIPDDWAGGSSCSIKSINKNIRITSVSFEAGPYATTIFGQQPTYSQHSTNALRFTKLKEYERFGAVFSFNRGGAPVPGAHESYTFDFDDIAPFIVSEGVVYRTKRTTVNGVRVPDAPLRIEPGYIPEVPELNEFTDKVMFLNGLAAKHNYRAGHSLWLPDGTFTNWRYSKIPIDSAFILFEPVCLVHYFPVDPSQVRSDGRVLLDKRWVQGHKDSNNRWRFIFVVAEPEGPKTPADFYR
ncbi:MAG: hypothetical protein OXC44_06650 [Proteobacteria bacterium]|nr:hypothetical protein [Pseudomonadota bacterium]